MKKKHLEKLKDHKLNILIFFFVAKIFTNVRVGIIHGVIFINAKVGIIHGGIFTNVEFLPTLELELFVATPESGLFMVGFLPTPELDLFEIEYSLAPESEIL